MSPPLGKIFHLPDVKGAIVTDVQAKGSAERAGLKRGDVVVRFDGQDVMDSGHLRNLVAQASIGSKHRLDLIRDGKLYQAELVIQEAPRERTKKAQPPQLRLLSIRSPGWSSMTSLHRWRARWIYR